MATTLYNNNSLYYTTNQNTWRLSLWNARDIPVMSSDQVLVLDQVYQYKPDLLAYDLYGSSRLFWVFMMRNKDLIFDPIYDMVAGMTLLVPTKDSLTSLLNS